jgi:hypothetical protein
MRFLSFIAGLSALAFAGVAQASTITLGSGETRVRVEADLAGLGLTPSLVGTTSVVNDPNGLVLSFPVTGGQLDGLAGSIEHEGSGVTLTAGATSVTVGNFIIDTVQQVIFGDVDLNGARIGDDLDLFSFDLSTVTPGQLTNLNTQFLALLITPTLAGALTQIFGAPDLENALFGFASTLPQEVPLPAAVWMFLAGLAGLATRLRATA